MCRRMLWWKIDPDVVTYGMMISAGERGGAVILIPLEVVVGWDWFHVVKIPDGTTLKLYVL